MNVMLYLQKSRNKEIITLNEYQKRHPLLFDSFD